ncbi:hypothetical protein BDB00DRAFT_791180 [Zychaea mexicana]|uniref:uncharacterized protein n=1 Tax=Zychaea mexicana TaxID=64656 RepID=UPI0022FE8B6A|nr:uncharacterized protein BDB00DRAFT_791180 [Zychaea mexicana]KAI9489293.1 hypothetical protein BDB00DRAFT_791180 [Zychaea mexicana]
MARQQKLSTGGTKSDIVERLLQHPQAEETVERRIHAVLAEQASKEKGQPGSKQTLLDSLSEDVNDHVETQPGRSSSNSDDANAEAQHRQHEKEDVAKKLEAERWVEAFELKLGNSRVRQSPKQPSMFSSTLRPSRPPRSDEASQQQQAADIKTNDIKNDDTPIPEDVDKAWVKAFEQKTTNRDLRQRMSGRDTFKATLDSIEPNVSDLIQPTTTKAKEGHPDKPHDQLQKSVGIGERENISSTDSGSGSSRNFMINSLVGSGLLIWIVSGQDGFSKIAATFLTTSSS